MTRLVMVKSGVDRKVPRHAGGATSVNRRLCAFAQQGLVYGNTLMDIANVLDEPQVVSVLETTSSLHRRRPGQTRTITVAFRSGRAKRIDSIRMAEWPPWVQRLMLYRRTLPKTPFSRVAIKEVKL